MALSKTTAKMNFLMLQGGIPGRCGLGTGELGMEHCCGFHTGIRREEGQGKLPVLGSTESCSSPAGAGEGVKDAPWEHHGLLLLLAWGTQTHREGNL